MKTANRATKQSDGVFQLDLWRRRSQLREDTPMPIALSDYHLRLVMTAAQPLPPDKASAAKADKSKIAVRRGRRQHEAASC